MPSQLALSPHPRSAARARAWVTSQLAAIDRHDLIDSAELGVSELVTNAIVHAGTPILVTLVVTSGQVRIEVQDGSSTRPKSIPANTVGSSATRPRADAASTSSRRWPASGASASTTPPARRSGSRRHRRRPRCSQRPQWTRGREAAATAAKPAEILRSPRPGCARPQLPHQNLARRCGGDPLTRRIAQAGRIPLGERPEPSSVSSPRPRTGGRKLRWGAGSSGRPTSGRRTTWRAPARCGQPHPYDAPAHRCNRDQPLTQSGVIDLGLLIARSVRLLVRSHPHLHEADRPVVGSPP